MWRIVHVRARSCRSVASTIGLLQPEHVQPCIVHTIVHLKLYIREVALLLWCSCRLDNLHAAHIPAGTQEAIRASLA